MALLENTQNQHIKSIYLDKKTLNLLDKVTNDLSISRSALIRILINQYCKEKQGSFGDIEKHVDILTNGRQRL